MVVGRANPPYLTIVPNIEMVRPLLQPPPYIVTSTWMLWVGVEPLAYYIITIFPYHQNIESSVGVGVERQGFKPFPF